MEMMILGLILFLACCARWHYSHRQRTRQRPGLTNMGVGPAALYQASHGPVDAFCFDHAGELLCP